MQISKVHHLSQRSRSQHDQRLQVVRFPPPLETFLLAPSLAPTFPSNAPNLFSKSPTYAYLPPTPKLTQEHSATTAALFGGVAGVAALFFFAEVPRVRKDIMIKIPIVGDYFVKELAPEDNPF